MKYSKFFVWSALVWLLAIGFSSANAGPIHKLQIAGHVSRAEDGEPLMGGRVIVWGVDSNVPPRLEAEGVTEIDGSFVLTLETDRPFCLVYIHQSEPATEGYDTLPSVERIDCSVGLHTLDFALAPASTIVLEGPLRLVDSSTRIWEYRCDVLDPTSDKPIRIGAYELVYGTGASSQNQYLGIEPNVIIVPVDTPFKLRLAPSYRVERTATRGWPGRRYRTTTLVGLREFLIGDGEGLVLSKGERLMLDLRRYSVASDLGVIEGLIDELEQALMTKREQEFYIVFESHELVKLKGLRDSAETAFSMGLFEDAYIAARQAYIAAVNLRLKLLGLEMEASVSLKELVVFIALTSIVSSYLLFEAWGRRMLFSLLLYAILLTYLYMIHPGRHVVSPPSLITVSLASLAAIFIIVSLMPKLAGRTKIDEGLPFLTSLGAISSMAKRSLLRRRLRFALTLTSILILSLSFVALTSASTGYGLLFSPQEWADARRSGIVIKQLQYTEHVRLPSSRPEMKGRFHEVTDEVVDWIGRREGVLTVARKAENAPSPPLPWHTRAKPYGFIGGQPIYGVLGFEPQLEPILQDVQECIVEGDFPIGEGDAVLISDHALKELGGSIGDIVTIGEVRLRITGTFDHRILYVRDLNGEYIVPNVMFDLTPPEAPTLIVQPCPYEELIITNLEPALRIHRDVSVSRVAMTLEEGVDPIDLAKSLALERGLMVWASTGSEVYAAHVGEYFVGKGLPIVIPWIIVILNVFITMLNSMYERRGEMAILSSVGLNPSHVAGIFFSEASITGIIGGGFGYLIGLGLYPLMSLLSSAPAVNQKISATWSLMTIGIAAAAAAVGVLVAIKGSVAITPSLERRWAIVGVPRTHMEPWIIPIPTRIEADSLGDFMSFMKRILTAYKSRLSYPNITGLREGEVEGGRTLSFWYREGDTGLGGISTSCALTMHREGPFYTAELHSYGSEKDIRKAGNFIRSLVIEWNTRAREGR